MQRALIIGLDADTLPKKDKSTTESLKELESLLQTAGASCAGSLLQHRSSPDPRYFIGKGKAEEARLTAAEEQADLIVVDNELSPSQSRSLSKATGLEVIDRSGLILDIFAQRAKTREGRLQVELAQYQYLLPRLSGMWTHLERQGATGAGYIGSRGPGETQLETDRRHVRAKIDYLKRELASVRAVRNTQREGRARLGLKNVALVGYTNSGKSTLLNALCGSDAQTGDRLFDTLDPQTRICRLDDRNECLVTDTVGFIRKLPHHLVEAFKATLEELRFADLIINVVDVSDPDWQEHMEVTLDVMIQLGVHEKPALIAANKCDIAEGAVPKDAVPVSALTGDGIDALKEAISSKAGLAEVLMSVFIPFGKGALVKSLHEECRILSTEHTGQGSRFTVMCPGASAHRYEMYVCD